MTDAERATARREEHFLAAKQGKAVSYPSGTLFLAPTDIHEHMDVLRELGSECDHITELGMRWANGSTVAFLAAQPKTLVSWDIDPMSIVDQRVAELLAVKGRTNFQPRVGNTLEVTLEETDLLFLDTLHTAKQLKAELERHSFVPGTWPPRPYVRKYLVFHDTMTFGRKGEDGSEPGLRAAIHWFQTKHAFPLWAVLHDFENNNGLIVMERVRP